MDSQQSSIEGQVLVKATAEIVSNFSSSFPSEEIIGMIFDALAEKLDEYKKKDQEKP